MAQEPRLKESHSRLPPPVPPFGYRCQTPMARSLRLSALLALAALGLGLAEVPQRRASPRPQKLAKDHAMMQVFADTVSGADRKDKFKVVKRQRPASPPPCPETDDEPEADNCEILDELSLR
uniref:Uncharacterized protein n=1 Tax=Alexandrium catenella TaxID=2925 RepID=A0A7S1MCF5_ALECA